MFSLICTPESLEPVAFGINIESRVQRVLHNNLLFNLSHVAMYVRTYIYQLLVIQ